MENQTAIEFKGVSKNYIKQRLRYGMLSDTLSSILGKAVRKNNTDNKNIIQALNNVSFKIKKGEVIGVIGPNGAGKSTILKLISKVTVPDSGTITANGRIGALIELGAGLHPELTGKENIYLYGAILGMKKKEVKNKFDEIVNFAEISDFLDMPIKRYSSGMYARLGFAVAVYTNPDILLIDEVLAVGDESFQHKCFRKMKELKNQKTTIVFVSHNLEWIKLICDRVLLFNKGQIVIEGTASSTISAYRRRLD